MIEVVTFVKFSLGLTLVAGGMGCSILFDGSNQNSNAINDGGGSLVDARINDAKVDSNNVVADAEVQDIPCTEDSYAIASNDMLIQMKPFENNAHCYIHLGNPLTGFDAEDRCQELTEGITLGLNLKSHLVSINDDDEYDFVSDNFNYNQKIWIGLRALTPGPNYSWSYTDGSVFTDGFTEQWNTVNVVEPNNSGELCVAQYHQELNSNLDIVDTHRWHNDTCDSDTRKFQFVCEIQRSE